MKKMLRKMICLLVSATLLFCVVCVPAHAATAETCTDIVGSTAAPKVFRVKVTPKMFGYDYVKLSHYQKGKYKYEYMLLGYWTGNHKAKSSYGYYKVTVKDQNGKTVKSLNWENSKSLTIKFGSWFKFKGSQFATKTYTVTVTPYTKEQMRKVAHYGYKNWMTHSKWKVYKTRGVGTCW